MQECIYKYGNYMQSFTYVYLIKDIIVQVRNLASYIHDQVDIIVMKYDVYEYYEIDFNYVSCKSTHNYCETDISFRYEQLSQC